MRIFGKILVKELREILTVGFFITIAASFLLFFVLGNFMGDLQESAMEDSENVAIADFDGSEYTRELIKSIKNGGMNVTEITGAKNELEALKKAEESGYTAVAVIKEGFGESIFNKNEKGEIVLVSAIKGVSLASSMDSGIGHSIVDSLNDGISTGLIARNGAGDPEFIKDPVKVSEISVNGDKSTNAAASDIYGFMMNQSIMMPLVIFLVIMMSSQMVASAIVKEKSDKTLETLFTAPVSRSKVLVAKMLAAGIASLIYAAAYMFGFSFYMSAMLGGVNGGDSAAAAAAALGFTLGPVQYIVIGVQLFMSILVALSISLILGTLVSDIKQIATVTMPMMFFILIPFFITMFTDIESLSLPVRILVMLIPFTHSFTVTPSMMQNDFIGPFLGLAYQFVFLAGAVALATYIINSDKIFTMSLSLDSLRIKKSKK